MRRKISGTLLGALLGVLEFCLYKESTSLACLGVFTLIPACLAFLIIPWVSEPPRSHGPTFND
jgi:F0F1-type ATP synthase assembly protein I